MRIMVESSLSGNFVGRGPEVPEVERAGETLPESSMPMQLHHWWILQGGRDCGVPAYRWDADLKVTFRATSPYRCLISGGFRNSASISCTLCSPLPPSSIMLEAHRPSFAIQNIAARLARNSSKTQCKSPNFGLGTGFLNSQHEHSTPCLRLCRFWGHFWPFSAVFGRFWQFSAAFGRNWAHQNFKKCGKVLSESCQQNVRMSKKKGFFRKNRKFP